MKKHYDTSPLKNRVKEFKEDAVKYAKEVKLTERYKHSVFEEETSKTLEQILRMCSRAGNIYITREKDDFQIVFMKDWYFAYLKYDSEMEDYFVNKYNLNLY